MCEKSNYIELAIRDLDKMISDLEQKRNEIDKEIEGYRISKEAFMKRLNIPEENTLIKEQKQFLNTVTSNENVSSHINKKSKKYDSFVAVEAIMDVVESHEDREKIWTSGEIKKILKDNGLARGTISSDLQRLVDKGKLEKIESENSKRVKFKLAAQKEVIKGKYTDWFVQDAIEDVINKNNDIKSWTTKQLKKYLKENGLVAVNISSDCARLADKEKIERFELDGINRYRAKRKDDSWINR